MKNALLTFALLFALTSYVSGQEVQTEQTLLDRENTVSPDVKRAPDINVHGKGDFVLGVPDDMGSLYIEFTSSPRLSAHLRDEFQRMGYRLATSKDEADLAVRMVAGFVFQKPRAKQMQIDFGKILEESKIDVVANKAEESTRTVGTELGPLVQGIQGNLGAGMVMGAGIVDSILSLSGVRGWFNKLVSGDERGLCLGTAEMCKDWKKYDQEMRIATFIERKSGGRFVIRSTAKAKDEKLVPEALFKAGMQDMTVRLFQSAENSPEGSL